MKLYSAIDLHSNNHYLTIIDEQDKRLVEKRLPNDLSNTLKVLAPYKSRITAIAVESTFNWYWLVDGLMEAGYSLKLVNTSKVKQYEGLKHTDDKDDAFWLAHLMRLGILPAGYIYPKEQRGVRDLLRERRRLVQQRAQNVITTQSTIWRNTGHRVPAKAIRGESEIKWPKLADENISLGVDAHRATIQVLNSQINLIERRVLKMVRSKPEYTMLLTVSGIGPILAWTILLETGELSRFENVGQFASYCRCVESKRISNEKKKGTNNAKNGNRYLAWAFYEAAHFAIQFLPPAKRFYERKATQRNEILAVNPDGHFNFPHPWPGQLPSLDVALRM